MAAPINVSADQLTTYEGPETTLELRIYANKTFTASDLQTIVSSPVAASDFYKGVACTVSAGVVSHAGFAIHSTEDILGGQKNPSYAFALFTDAGAYVKDVYAKIRVPATPANTTMAALVAFSYPPSALTSSLLTIAQIFAYLATLFAAITKATEVVWGLVRLDTAAISIGDPVAVSTSSPRLSRSLALDYASNAAAAIAAIGVTECDLAVDASITLNNTTFPDNIRVLLPRGAVISVNAGQTVTIKNLIPPTSRKCFGGLGTVSLPNISEKEVTWWTGTDQVGDQTANINAFLRTGLANPGSKFKPPPITLKTTGGHVVPNYTTIDTGGGFDPDTVVGCVFKLTNAAAAWVFKFTNPYVKSIKLAGFGIDARAATNVNHKAVLLQDGAPNGSVDVTLNIAVNCAGAAVGVIGFELSSTGFGDYYAEFVKLDHCWFNGAPASPCVRMNTYNCSVRSQETMYQAGAGGGAVFCDTVGMYKGSGDAFNGSGLIVYSDNVQRTITGNITIGTSLLEAATGSFTIEDLGNKVFIAGAVDTYIKWIDKDGKAELADPATGTSVGGNLQVRRALYQSGGSDYCIRVSNEYAVVALDNIQEENNRYFLKVDGGIDWGASIIQITDSIVQGAFKLDSQCSIKINGGRVSAQAWEIGVATIRADLHTQIITHVPWDWPNRTIKKGHLARTNAGALVIGQDFSTGIYNDSNEYMMRRPFQFKHGAEYYGSDTERPVTEIASINPDQVLARWGVLGGPLDEFKYGYTARRRGDNGQLHWQGISPGFPSYLGYRFSDGPLQIDSALIATPTTGDQITSNQNDYTPLIGGSGHTFGGGFMTHIKSDAARNITGWIANTIQQQHGVTRICVNTGAFAITLKHQDAASSAVNRFYCTTGGDLVVPAKAMFIKTYNVTLGYWHVSLLP